ncbi:hypothetical protein OIE66_37135 [Nonomuraea sp. NBC_01738]|uniref:hypothetical protein n=1 Tax=Nonomuraea sp. NBC_01738 TaxID=2976003 RepID=UPI002E147DA6|nr:hypothetical protein OIE66_37135 [Nonomuraea sp. NBC_01738]
MPNLLAALGRTFWRLDALIGGTKPPPAGPRFAAAHPILLGLIAGPLLGVLNWVILLGGVPAFLLYGVGYAVIFGMLFTAVGYGERMRQKHYGHYPPD